MLKTVVATAMAAVGITMGAGAANAFTPQDELKFFLMDHQDWSPDFKQDDVDSSRVICGILDHRVPGDKARLIAIDRRYPSIGVGHLGVTDTEVSVLIYCPQHLLSS
ncbi:hypothetical protein NONI108955_29715 [Nocardia ninae]|uniref:DUF732 domain-containing protein n=1 Tax=Nocardia ninae NBRC 108245 TaxID=1210091 RepID=A0A511MTK0_9NOCA|nr:hypothetical protein [Nocardia ninae]GEM43909.1 hypothetical protein NN4_84280 [Nocardia ninae NBRC 108245]